MDSNLLIGIIGLIVAIAAYNLSRKTYKKDYEEKPDDDKLHLTAQFRSTQTLSKQVYKNLLAHVERYNAYDQFMFPGITYRAYISKLLESHGAGGNLSDETLENVLSLWPIPDLTLQSMCKSLETQFEALNEIQQIILLQAATIDLNSQTE